MKLFKNDDYEKAFIGRTESGRAVYDYDLMIEYLINKYGWEFDECVMDRLQHGLQFTNR